MPFVGPPDAQVAAAVPPPSAPAVVGPFAGQLVVAVNRQRERERDGRTTAVVMQWFAFRRPNGQEIVVPAGYVTDFASVPRIGRWFMPPFGRHAIAAVLHDWLYSVGQPGRRADADQVPWEALTELQVDDLQRGVMHQTVKLFGSRGYERAAVDWVVSFMDWRTGEWLDPPAPRELFFNGGDPDLIAWIKDQPPLNCAA